MNFLYSFLLSLVLLPSVAFGAIAVDAVSSGANGTDTTRSVSHTVSGSDRLLLVGVYTEKSGDAGTECITGVTWNGVSMTKISTKIRSNNLGYMYLYGLVAPDTGTHTAVASCSATAYMTIQAVSYTGVYQDSVPTVHNEGASNTGTSLDVSVTVTVDDSWLSGYGLADNCGFGAGTNGTLQGSVFNCSEGWVDSNGVLSTGSNTIGIVGSTGSNFIYNVVQIVPAGAVVDTPPVYPTSTLMHFETVQSVWFVVFIAFFMYFVLMVVRSIM